MSNKNIFILSKENGSEANADFSDVEHDGVPDEPLHYNLISILRRDVLVADLLDRSFESKNYHEVLDAVKSYH